MNKKESKLKENDYVRTKYRIEKIICIEENFMDDNVTFYATDNDIWRGAYNGRYNGFTSRSDEIIKSSSNIVDLLEKGDLLKLYYSKQYQEIIAINENEIDLTDFIFFDLQESKEQFEKEIEWVITHEQLNEAKYEVSK